jgi:hypothetical protein
MRDMKELNCRIQRDIASYLARTHSDLDAPTRSKLSKVFANIAEDNFINFNRSSNTILDDPRPIKSVTSADLEEAYWWEVGRELPEGKITFIEMYAESIGGQEYPWIKIYVGGQIVKRVAASSFVISYFIEKKENTD